LRIAETHPLLPPPRLPIKSIEIHPDSGRRGAGGSDGIIGNAILLKFNTVFDLSRGKMYLQPLAKQ
jgi:hypothetical protein